MNQNPLCDDCGLFPTHHKCTVCHQRHACGVCHSKKGNEDLNHRPCAICDNTGVNLAASESAVELDAPPPNADVALEPEPKRIKIRDEVCQDSASLYVIVQLHQEILTHRCYLAQISIKNRQRRQ